ncbi:MAG: RNA 2',3'-cyclic phosphodiesterase [Elusimicrobia bacterium]|nr:RNA 2',3'-cyclic phosphodiesterase [Elusimicrobiota bacterium]
MRLFIAVNINDENKNKIVQIQTGLKNDITDIKWVEKENLHLTLKFLGEVADGRLDALKKRIKETGSLTKDFEIDFCNLGVFPKETFSRILWIGIDKGQDGLKSLAQKLEDSLEAAGFKKEKRPFSAHLTIGRFKKPKPCKISGLPYKEEKFSETVEKISLVKSTLTSKGPIYEVIEGFKLEGR